VALPRTLAPGSVKRVVTSVRVFDRSVFQRRLGRNPVLDEGADAVPICFGHVGELVRVVLDACIVLPRP